MTITETRRLDIERAFPRDVAAPVDSEARLNCLRELHEHYMKFFTPPEDSLGLGDWETPEEIALIEAEWNRYEEERARPALADLPTKPKEFNDWFLAVGKEHEYQDVCDYLRHEASMLDIALMVFAEDKVDSRFDDLMAVAQLGSSGVPKMTIAHNYWDEMGDGHYEGVHTTMFNNTAKWMREQVVEPSGFDFNKLEFAEAYANACELLMYNLRRRYALRGLAGIGLLEQSAPARFAATVDGCRRLGGVPEDVIRYQVVHAHVDQDHSREWIEGVFTPIAEKNPDAIPEFAIGVIIRGNVASEFFHQVKKTLFEQG